jgi:hypothetical protein
MSNDYDFSINIVNNNRIINIAPDPNSYVRDIRLLLEKRYHLKNKNYLLKFKGLYVLIFI